MEPELNAQNELMRYANEFPEPAYTGDPRCVAKGLQSSAAKRGTPLRFALRTVGHDQKAHLPNFPANLFRTPKRRGKSRYNNRCFRAWPFDAMGTTALCTLLPSKDRSEKADHPHPPATLNLFHPTPRFLYKHLRGTHSSAEITYPMHKAKESSHSTSAQPIVGRDHGGQRAESDPELRSNRSPSSCFTENRHHRGEPARRQRRHQPETTVYSAKTFHGAVGTNGSRVGKKKMEP